MSEFYQPTLRFEPILDWQPRFDPRSLSHKIAGLGPLKERSRTWTRSLWLDQGSEGACVGYSFAHLMATTPKKRAGVDADFAEMMYREAQKNDEWPGQDYEGSSVLGAMQAGKADGYIKSYAWCTTMPELVHAVGYLGPVQIGINWYEDMFEPDKAGLLHVGGKVVGGHAILVGGVNVATATFTLFNSWGKGWGQGGNAKVTFADMATLMDQGGEFALPKKA